MRRYLIVLLTMLAAFAVASPAPAQAENTPPTLRTNSAGCMIHNHKPLQYTIKVTSLPTNYVTALNQAAEQWNAVSNANWNVKVYSGAAANLVDWNVEAVLDPDMSLWGQWTDNRASVDGCHWTAGTLKFSPNVADLNRPYLACHEMGHGLGLGHGGDGCMNGDAELGPINTSLARDVPGTDAPALLRNAYNSAGH